MRNEALRNICAGFLVVSCNIRKRATCDGSTFMGRHGTALILAMCVQVAFIHAADWPQFRGPNRDGKSPETGLLKKWPEAGPRLVRTVSGVGEGFSSPSIAGGRIYITG